MIIDMIVFLTFAVAMGTIIVKAYEWRQDVLYGPYIFPASQVTIGNRPRWISKLASFTLIFVICTTMLSWLGFLSWGAYSVALWLWQLIVGLSDELSLAGLFD